MYGNHIRAMLDQITFSCESEVAQGAQPFKFFPLLISHFALTSVLLPLLLLVCWCCWHYFNLLPMIPALRFEKKNLIPWSLGLESSHGFITHLHQSPQRYCHCPVYLVTGSLRPTCLTCLNQFWLGKTSLSSQKWSWCPDSSELFYCPFGGHWSVLLLPGYYHDADPFDTLLTSARFMDLSLTWPVMID